MTRPLVIAHRGGAGEAPENTIAAFVRARDLGVDGLECDVHLTRDGVVVVHHDPDLKLAAEGPRVGIGEAEAAAVLAADLGWTHGAAHRGHRVPTLDAFLGVGEGLALMIELKPGPQGPALGAAVGRRIAQVAPGPDRDRLLAASYDPSALAACHDTCPGIMMLGVARGDTRTPELEALPLAGWAVERSAVTVAAVAAGQAAGQVTWGWTVDAPGQVASLTAAGVDGLITDIPAAILALVDDQ